MIERTTLDCTPPHLPTRYDSDGVLDVDHHLTEWYVNFLLSPQWYNRRLPPPPPSHFRDHAF